MQGPLEVDQAEVIRLVNDASPAYDRVAREGLKFCSGFGPLLAVKHSRVWSKKPS